MSNGNDENKLIAALCYIIGILVPLFVIFTEKKKDKFVAFHAYQSLLLTVVIFAIYIAVGILIGIIAWIPFVNFLALLLGGLLSLFGLAVFVLIVYLAYKAFKGEKYLLPTLGAMAEKYANQ